MRRLGNKLLTLIVATSIIATLVFVFGIWVISHLDAREATESERKLIKERIGNFEITSLTVKGHQYLFFDKPSRTGLGGIIHDPDCPCHTNTEN